jgi:hypothetical protein
MPRVAGCPQDAQIGYGIKMLRGGPFGLLSALMRTINQFSSDADLTEKHNHLYQPTFWKEMYICIRPQTINFFHPSCSIAKTRGQTKNLITAVRFGAVKFK